MSLSIFIRLPYFLNPFVFIFQFNPSSVYPAYICPRTPDIVLRHFLTTRANLEDKACFCEEAKDFWKPHKKSKKKIFWKKKKKNTTHLLNWFTNNSSKKSCFFLSKPRSPSISCRSAAPSSNEIKKQKKIQFLKKLWCFMRKSKWWYF